MLCKTVVFYDGSGKNTKLELAGMYLDVTDDGIITVSVTIDPNF